MVMTKSEAERLRGTDVYSADGDSIGAVDEVFVDRATGAPEWLGIKRGVIGAKWTVVPLATVTIQGDEIHASYSTKEIENAPHVSGREITDSEEDTLYAHYGLRRSTAASDSGLPRGTEPQQPSASERVGAEQASSRKRAAYHVTPDDKGWKTVEEGEDRPVATGKRKDEVVQRARRVAKKEEAQLIIHKKDGHIQEERTYGADPVSSKG